MEEDPRKEKIHYQPTEGLKNVKVDGLGKVVQIGAALREKEVKALSMLLVEFKELFAWKHSDMPMISK